MRVGMYEVREQLVHLAEGRFSLTGRGRYVTLGRDVKHFTDSMLGTCRHQSYLRRQDHK